MQADRKQKCLRFDVKTIKSVKFVEIRVCGQQLLRKSTKKIFTLNKFVILFWKLHLLYSSNLRCHLTEWNEDDFIILISALQSFSTSSLYFLQPIQRCGAFIDFLPDAEIIYS